MTDLIELFHERAAILEYDAGFARPEAEKRAYFELRNRFGREAIPKEVLDVMKGCAKDGGKLDQV